MCGWWCLLVVGGSVFLVEFSVFIDFGFGDVGKGKFVDVWVCVCVVYMVVCFNGGV